MRVEIALALTVGLTVASLTPPAHEASPTTSLKRMEKFVPLYERLEKARGASVSSVCGSAIAPWAYRGRTHGRKSALRAYVTDEADERWTKEFVRTLMRETDWDSTMKCEGSSKPCDSVHQVPLFLVKLHARGDVYALLDFEKRCAQVFEADRPLGLAHFDDRADSLFEMVRGALRSDSLTQTLSLPAERAETGLAGRPFGYDPSQVERLPEPTRKVAPSYPEAARQAKVDGKVWIQALVDRDGTIADAFVIQSIKELDEAALDAVWQWKFKPAASGGEPISVWVAIPVKFSLH